MDYKDIEKLIDKLDKSSLSHFEYEKDNFKLIIKKETAVQYAEMPQPKKALTEAAPAVIHTKEAEILEDKNIILVKSPIVGTLYTSSSPDAPAFVTAGSKVKKGDTLCIIEAMKLMNEIEAEADGEVLEVLCENESMVEFGEVIFKIKKEK
ncbi:MAG: acetyl-CoA carboxylase biotin carboxyl carrier protein [Clostridiaceae bacterium]